MLLKLSDPPIVLENKLDGVNLDLLHETDLSSLWHNFRSIDISDVSDHLEESEISKLNNVTVTCTFNLIDNIKFDVNGKNKHTTFDRFHSSNVENESNPKLADVITDVKAVTQYDMPF